MHFVGSKQVWRGVFLAWSKTVFVIVCSWCLLKVDSTTVGQQMRNRDRHRTSAVLGGKQVDYLLPIEDLLFRADAWIASRWDTSVRLHWCIWLPSGRSWIRLFHWLGASGIPLVDFKSRTDLLEEEPVEQLYSAPFEASWLRQVAQGCNSKASWLIDFGQRP